MVKYHQSTNIGNRFSLSIFYAQKRFAVGVPFCHDKTDLGTAIFSVIMALLGAGLNALQ